MNHAGWLSGTDPTPMLEFVRAGASDRKRRLFGCACCRRVWPHLTEGVGRSGVEAVERHADGRASDDELASVSQRGYAYGRAQYDRYERLRLAPDAGAGADRAFAASQEGFAVHAAAEARRHTSYPPVSDYAAALAAAAALGRAAWGGNRDEPVRAYREERCAHAALLRDIFGDPFRRVALPDGWRTPDVVALAQSAYDGRTFDGLPVLADALQDAGCYYPDVLHHCRQPEAHARGCWVVDLILGKA